MKAVRIACLFVLISSAAYAQYPVFVNAQYMTGGIMAHRDGMDVLQNGLVQGVELELGMQMSANKDWHVAYGHPMTGVGFHYDYLSNPEILGYAAGIYGFIELPVYRTSQFELMYRLTSGLTYLSKRFNEDDNPQNVAISTRVNYLFHTGFRARYWMNDESAIGAGFGLSHYSNGGTNTPNKGLNQINIMLGFTHYLSGSYNEYSGAKRPIVWKPQHEFYLMGVYGWSDISKNTPPNAGTNQTYPTAGATLGYNYRYAAHRKLGLSFDVFYNESYNWTYWDGFIAYGLSWQDLTRYGMAINHEFVFNRLSILIAGGVYLKQYEDLGGAMHVKSLEWAYERLGFRYYPIENMFLNVSVKAYGFKAETVEFGVGFSIRTKE